MPKKKTRSAEEEKFDQIAQYLYGGSKASARKQFTSNIFQEWLKLHSDIVKAALAPPASSEDEIIQLIKKIMIERQTVPLKDLLKLINQKSVINTLTELKPFIKKIQFPSNYNFSYPKSLKGSSILKVQKSEIQIEDFIFHLRQAYERVPSRMGDMVEIPLLAQILAEETGWSIDQIHTRIYQAYLEKKVDLQPGKVTEGKVLEAEDGSKFTWFQFR